MTTILHHRRPVVKVCFLLAVLTIPTTVLSLAANRPTEPSSSSNSPNNNNNNNDNGASSSSLIKLAKDVGQGKYTNIVVLVGAGMSVSAGIPDFRTPGSGLYSQLAKYNLPYPEAIFELSYYRQNPKPFLTVACQIWPGQAGGPKPTLAHSFLALLEQRGLLKRIYTQNIDGLERLAGVSDSKLIECHGHFATSSCISPTCDLKNNRELSVECQKSFQNGEVFMCPKCQNSIVKPDIVFFGETLPDIFSEKIDQDIEDCDLLIVIGTSLLVAPVASIPNWVSLQTPRLLINRDLVGTFVRKQRRDTILQGDCDDGIETLCEHIGKDWVTDLNELHANNQ